MLLVKNPATVDSPRGACRKTQREALGFAQAPCLRSIGLGFLWYNFV